MGDIKTVNQERPAVVSIIGGSHSGFSIAWLLMNGPFRPPRQFDPPGEFLRQAKSGFYLSPPSKGPNISYFDYTPSSVQVKI